MTSAVFHVHVQAANCVLYSLVLFSCRGHFSICVWQCNAETLSNVSFFWLTSLVLNNAITHSIFCKYTRTCIASKRMCSILTRALPK